MVSALPVDAISDPTRSLLELYDANQDIDEFPTKVTAHFADIFASKDAFSEIPSIHAVDPRQRDRCLVSFRAMIQDTSPSPEMYLAKRSGGQCGGWGLADDASSEDLDYADLRECTVVWAVNVPGESDWVASEVDGPNVPSFSRSVLPETHPHKFPVLGASHLGLQVKIYDSSRADSLKSTDVTTLVGILTFESTGLETDHDPPQVPTLHVLFSRTLPLPMVPRTFPYSPGKSSIEALRDELLSWIATEGLAGDKDAAEWILLNIIGRVQSRIPPLLPLSLTLSKFPPPPSQSSTPSICTVLSHLLPIAITLPLSLDLLNTSPFAPESKYEELCSGRLQLPHGTACVVTEGGITEGGLVEKGIMNLRTLQGMITNQTLEYAFPFSTFAFQTDVTFLILAEGRKSTFFQTHMNVPLRVDASKSAELYKSVKLPPPETLAMFRELVGGAKMGSVTIGDTVAEYIQEDFVKERKAAATPAEAITSDHLIHRMTVARLLTLSMHQSEVTIDIWERVKALETVREARLNTLGTQ
ncbi:mini-chromosome maintenance replisome factor-domain-containing protein [Mycena sanguinolenta]|nr:mini-chromosome maintenance replisome factor-domain-containing protein [Mycena sanguinolenta]